MLRSALVTATYVATNYALAMAFSFRKARGGFVSRAFLSKASSMLLSSPHMVSDETLNDSKPVVRAHWHNHDGEHAYLEEVDGYEALAWVRERNKATLDKFGDPKEKQLYHEILSILESKDRIPHVWKMGDHYYNYWDDEKYPRGIIRRTSPSEYEKSDPNWDTVLNFEELGKKEGESWVYKTMDVYRPDDEKVKPTRVLLSISRGGADASVIREFDLVTLDFVEGGFSLPEAKSQVTWLDQDTLLVGTDMKDGESMTDSGYPRTVREWKRGTVLSESTLLAHCSKTDLSIMSYVSKHKGFKYVCRHTAMTFYTSKDSIQVPGHEEFVDVPRQDDASVSIFANQMLLSLRSEWKCKQATFAPGTLLSAPIDEFLNKGDASTFTVLFEPTSVSSLFTWTYTLNYVALTLLDHVKVCFSM